MSPTPAIPGWEWSDLNQLSSSGELSGVSPTVIGSIDQAESSGVGGGVNSEGFGGFFGLGEHSTYPGGASSPALLESSSPASFMEQAQLAASAFASYLTKEGGDPQKAEEVYQTGQANGPTEGSIILATNLGSSPPLSGAVTTSATTTGLNGNPFNDDGLDPFNIFGTIGGAAGSAASSAGSAAVQGATSVLGGLIAPLKTYIEDGTLVIFGLIVIVVGLVVLAHSVLSAGSGSGASSAASSAAGASFGASRAPRRSQSVSQAPEPPPRRQYGGVTDNRPKQKALPAAGQTTEGMGSGVGADAVAALA